MSPLKGPWRLWGSCCCCYPLHTGITTWLATASVSSAFILGVSSCLPWALMQQPTAWPSDEELDEMFEANFLKQIIKFVQTFCLRGYWLLVFVFWVPGILLLLIGFWGFYGMLTEGKRSMTAALWLTVTLFVVMMFDSLAMAVFFPLWDAVSWFSCEITIAFGLIAIVFGTTLPWSMWSYIQVLAIGGTGLEYKAAPLLMSHVELMEDRTDVGDVVGRVTDSAGLMSHEIV